MVIFHCYSSTIPHIFVLITEGYDDTTMVIFHYNGKQDNGGMSIWFHELEGAITFL